MKCVAPITYLILSLLVSVAGCSRSGPAPTLSAKDTDPERLTYNLKTVVEAYQKVGHQNSKWDGDAIHCLTAFARMRALTNHSPDETVDELRRLLPRLVDKN